MKDLTLKQSALLGIIRAGIEAHGYAPSVREMCSAYGVSSSCTVQRCVDALERKGYVRRSRYKYRSLELTDLAGGLPSYADLTAANERLELELSVARAEILRLRGAA